MDRTLVLVHCQLPADSFELGSFERHEPGAGFNSKRKA